MRQPLDDPGMFFFFLAWCVAQVQAQQQILDIVLYGTADPKLS